MFQDWQFYTTYGTIVFCIVGFVGDSDIFELVGNSLITNVVGLSVTFVLSVGFAYGKYILIIYTNMTHEVNRKYLL